MGDAQSAQREGRQDAAAAEEERGKVDDAQTEQNTKDKLLKNNEQISEINGKADGAIENVNGQCEDEIAAEAVLSPDEDVSETEKPLQGKPPLKNVDIHKKESPTEAKQNDINEGFRKFFSNIGVKLTIKKGSSEIATDVSDETNKDKPNRPENIEETKSEHAELNTDGNIAQETCDNDSTTCPTLTDGISEDTLENAGEKKIETKEEVESNNAEAATMSPLGEEAHLDATPEDKPQSTSPQSPEEEVVVTPIKRFFTTGIFSGLRKKKKPADNEATEKEQIDMGKTEVTETTEQTVQDRKQDKEEISPGVEAASVEAEHKDKENELKAEILSAASAQTTDEGKSSSTDPSTIIVTEPEILSSQEKDKVQASPLKRLLSGSNLKKLSKKQRSRRSSDAKVSDSGEHISDQLLSSTESPENQKEEGPAQPTAEPAEEEDGAWASFRKKLIKRFSLTNEEKQIPGSVEEPKTSEGEQISDHSTDEGKKRKDSSVSWEAVLCGSGRRRSRKTSDSEDETPQNDNKGHKQDGGSKHVAESHLESSNENEILASSPNQAGSPSEGDGGSTWKSLKRLVTPKRKPKDEDESKDNIQSDSEVTQDESSFSIKKILPGRKKKKSAEKQDQVSSDEADKDVASGDEDSETPAVVPLSEFDTVEAEVNIQTQADIESHIPEEANSDLQQDLLDQMAEPVLPCDSLQTEAKKVQGNDDTLEKKISTIPEESDDLTESISKHQQLSDIPEEGIITETMGTPASVTEEAAKDDTIAEDLIEITSEAITAPEPASDITLADETEMISAVSQLSSESSKTSGNTTPVPAEHDIMETDTLLQQVVETIGISPMAAPVCSEVLNSEKVVSSLSRQILETFAKEEPTILEIHRRLDATAIKTGLYVEELDAINELAATSQTESIFEVNNSVSTEVVSETPTEEFNTADTTVDEIQEANLTHPEESVKELERIDGSDQLVQCPFEINAAVSTDTLPEGEEIVPDVGSLVEAYQAETKDGTIEQEVQTTMLQLQMKPNMKCISV
ncbi:A-kinase anchor protein 12 [Chaetodon trifascialis]|uniref:A-kinase anchor protein 12 n=1 Tax=Chaetodon trifascialis TaxID=109706 RepID=UPI0039930160